MSVFQYNNNITPYDLTSINSSLYPKRQNLSNYGITSSSEYKVYTEHYWIEAFDDDPYDGAPATESGSYGAGGIPNNPSNVLISGQYYTGHWVQLDINENVLVKTFEYYPHANYASTAWEKLLIAGSKDGITWELLWRKTDRVQSTDASKETYHINANDVYSKFIWLCEKNFVGAYWASGELRLLGQTEEEAIIYISPPTSSSGGSGETISLKEKIAKKVEQSKQRYDRKSGSMLSLINKKYISRRARRTKMNFYDPTDRERNKILGQKNPLFRRKGKPLKNASLGSAGALSNYIQRRIQ